MRAKIGKITGPPGCGKSTEIMRLIAKACDRYFPGNIGAVSYTKAAVEELRSRVSALTGANKKLLKNVTTIHAKCFRLLELHQGDVAESHISEFNKAHPRYAIKESDNPDENDINTTGDMDRLYALMNIYRNQMIPMEKWQIDVRAFGEVWFSWIRECGYTDFTGMLEGVLKDELSPGMEILFVDETQDLTQLQMAVINLWSQDAENTTFAGDSDQCIYRWTGTVPESFIQLENQWRKHLDQSYRVPPLVHDYAAKICHHIGNRENLDYAPDIRRGTGSVMRGLLYPELEKDGDHMILVRCNYQTRHWIEWLKSNNQIWHNPYRPDNLYWNPTETRGWRSASVLHDIVNMKIVDVKDFLHLLDDIKAKDFMMRGMKNVIPGMLKAGDKISIFDLPNLGFIPDKISNIDTMPIQDIIRIKGSMADYIKKTYNEAVASERHDNPFHQTPKIIIGTVHSVKGGEASNVWLDSEVTSKILNLILRDKRSRYDEARVAYVGATRAKNNLGILEARCRNPLLP